MSSAISGRSRRQLLAHPWLEGLLADSDCCLQQRMRSMWGRLSIKKEGRSVHMQLRVNW